MKLILVIWEEIPDNCKLLNFFLEDYEANQLILWNNNFIGAADNQHEEAMNKFFYTNEGDFKHKDAEVQLPFGRGSFDKIVRMGCFL